LHSLEAAAAEEIGSGKVPSAGGATMLIGRDLSRAIDPVLLAHDCGLTPDPWQAAVLAERPKRCCCCVPGKAASRL
jgi:hypothetical protein